MVHTYRDPDLIKSKFFRPLHLVFWVPFLVLVLAFIGDTWVFSSSPRPWITALVSVGVVLFVLMCQYAAYRRDHYGTCSVIRLSDDGTCELETKRRVIRLHVNEIQSVRFSPETSEQGESYTIRYRGGKLDVNARRMTGFADFLTRLKALNPAADLSSFPAGWPNADEEETGVGSVLFPLIIIIFLALIAWHTFSS